MKFNTPDTPAFGDEEMAFGPFRFFPGRQLLLDMDKPVALGGRALDILATLANNAGQVVSKGELTARVWPGVFVEDGSLRAHVASLRKALRDGREGRRFIVTTPGRGYCLAAPVSRPEGKTSVARYGAPERRTDNLPRPMTRMVGRDGAVEALLAEMPQRRFISIVGPGGIGKTTFALAVASALRPSYRDGVRFVDLAPIVDPALVPSVLAAALGLPVSSDTPIPDLLTALREKHVLLLLDNCERVIDAAATLADEVFRGAPNVHILATTREALRVEGECIRRLAPLDAPPDMPGITAQEALAFPAVQLFVERMTDTLGLCELSDADAPVVSEICRRLDGIALAIELAAARVETFGTRGVASRLDDRFRLLTRGYRTALPRHQTLKAAFDWSYGALAEATRIVFRRLAVLAGEFTLDSAVAIASADGVNEPDVANQVANLVSASLLAVDIAGEAACFRYLDSTRAYAHEKLCESGEFDRFARRHCEYVLDTLCRAGAELATWSPGKWLNAYGRQIDNVRVSLDWAFSTHGDPLLGADLTIVAAPLWSLMSLNEECRSRVETALASLGQGTSRDGREMQLLAALGAALMYTRSPSLSTDQIWASTLRLAEGLQDTDYQVRAVKGVWTEAYNGGDIRSAVAVGEHFGRVSATSDDPSDALLNSRIVAMGHYYVGDLAVARACIERALNGYAKTPRALDLVRFQFDQRMIAGTILAKVLWLQGFPDQARRMAELTVEFARAADHARSITYALAYIACQIELLNGDLEQAERYMIDIFQRALLDPSGQWDAMGRCWKGVLLSMQGDVTAATHLLASALDGVPENSFRMHYTMFLGELAHAMGRAGEFAKASEAIGRAVGVCDRLGERWGFAELLRIKGEIALMEGGPRAAAAAEDHFEQSLGWARRQGALSWELRAAVSLARLRLAQTRPHDAREVLAPVYGRFTEGFATRDLKAAKSLLDKLA